MCIESRKRSRSPASDVMALQDKHACVASQDETTPTSVSDVEGATGERRRRSLKRARTTLSIPAQTSETSTTTTTTTVTASHRDEIMAAILTIASALGLTKETLHVCVDLLDRYLSLATVQASTLETLSIACLWIAVKFIETPDTIASKQIKQILKRRRHSGNWTWPEILRQESEIMRVLRFRILSPTVLNLLQHRIHEASDDLTPAQVHLAYYFADLLLLKSRVNEYSKDMLVDAIWFIIQGHQIAEVQQPLLAPVLILVLAHRDNINPNHPVYKAWFALRCQYGRFLPAPWQVPYDQACVCRVCEYSAEIKEACTRSKAVIKRHQRPNRVQKMPETLVAPTVRAE
ncbi:hypothetical protein Poli38472_000702 [Pythium oligandrum]|uniref:Cyclin-like domain-containing protein n=1 Tax=Pythium oligandrum TaxID=41045 RepID=A0A8K1FEL0_PYTOL|nr:hypothetical protein Poli38472_000702 [Pythium oligandrum]|eukprot:TMW60660.1 hypothetical protein Poli38472_000702 [Pythium oligandrum]